MKLTRQITLVLLLMVCVVGTSCGREEPAPVAPTLAVVSPATATVAPTATAEPTDTPTITPSPEPTQVPASVSGRVLWGSLPVAGARIELNSAADESGVASAVAGAAGQFLVAAVPPGEYSLIAIWPDGNANASEPMNLTLEAGAAEDNLTLTLEKPLELLGPDPSTPAPTLPTITWEQAPDSAQYHVTITDTNTDQTVVDVMVSDTELDLVEQLSVSTDYELNIAAVDQAGAALARYAGTMHTQDTPTPPRAVVLPAVCGQPGLPTFLDRSLGICFAYPQDHFMSVDGTDATITGPPVSAGSVYFPSVSVKKLPADGLDLAEWVGRYLESLPAGVAPVERLPATVAGSAAEILEPVPGELSSRQVAVANGSDVLLLTFAPTFRDVPADEQDFLQRKVQTAADNLFETVMATLVILPRKAAANEGGVELPAACIVDGMSLVVDAESELCLAIPPGFTAQRTPQGLPRLIGPALDASLSPVRASFSMELPEAIDGRSLAEIVDAYVSAVGGDDTVQTEIMVGGETAVLIDDLPNGRGSQEVFLLHEEQVYHLIFQPDPGQVPLAGADMARLLNEVIATFSFLRPGE